MLVTACPAEGPGAPTDLRCEYWVNPLGIDVPRPRLSWRVNDPRRRAVQSAYRIIVATGAEEVWDSGKVESDQSVHVPYAGRPLRSGCRYRWKVRTWDAAGTPSPWSQEAWWETGLLSPGEWQARWITIADAPGAGKPPAGSAPAPGRRALRFRREFRLPGRCVRARAYVSGLGVYELAINGRRVGDDIFCPGWTNYARRVQYQTYDVTDLLKAGDNAVGAEVGSGWWNGMDGRGARKPRLVLQLAIECAGGRRVTVVTDGSWKARPAPILYDAFYHGETCDARLAAPGWDAPGFDDRAWRPVVVLKDKVDRLIAQQAPPIRVSVELAAKEVSRPGEGVYVFDFGQNASGRCRLKVAGAKPGTKVRIRHAEVLKPDGSIYTANYRSARATDTYVCRGGGQEAWEPRFTYRGFRYAELTGYPGEPPKDALVFRVFHSAVDRTGRFRCSSDLINRIHENVNWGLISNLHSVPTDCPQRDERLGWTGDAQVIAPTACWNRDMSLLLAKWMRDVIHHGGGGEVKGDGPGWADAAVVVPWTLYLFYGDRRIVQESYAKMAAFVDARTRRAKGGLYERKGYGDWIAVDRRTPKEFIGSAYYYHSVKLLARMAAAVGRDDDARRYAALAEQIARAFQRKYFDPEANRYPPGTQTCFVLPLHFGLVPPDRRAAVAENLVREIAARDHHPSTGFLGTAYLLPVLAAAGRHETACRLAGQKTYPSWGYMVRTGATTIWELWNSDRAGPGMNSRNHFALGAIGRWFFESLGGIRPDPQRPGFQHAIIRPAPAGELTWAQAEHVSMYGPIRSAWKLADGRLTLEVTVPANATATVHVPAGGPEAVTEGGRPAGRAEGVTFLKAAKGAAIYRVGAGTYRFVSSVP